MNDSHTKAFPPSQPAAQQPLPPPQSAAQQPLHPPRPADQQPLPHPQTAAQQPLPPPQPAAKQPLLPAAAGAGFSLDVNPAYFPTTLPAQSSGDCEGYYNLGANTDDRLSNDFMWLSNSNCSIITHTYELILYFE